MRRETRVHHTFSGWARRPLRTLTECGMIVRNYDAVLDWESVNCPQCIERKVAGSIVRLCWRCDQRIVRITHHAHNSCAGGWYAAD